MNTAASSAGALGDEVRVRRISRRIGLLVGISSCVIIAAGISVLVIVILATARPERGVGHEPSDLDHVVIDVDQVVPWLVAFGIIAVLLLGVIAWVSARRAVRPLAGALRLQREFVADASHELRTPLTALVSRIQILERRQARGEPIEDVITKLHGDADAMTETLTDLLTIAAAEDARNGDAEGHNWRTALACASAAVEAAVERLAPLADERRVHIDFENRPHSDRSEGAMVQLSEVALSRACIVLLDNAIGHTPDGGTVAVSCRAGATTVEIRVEDHGPGIPSEDQERIFERFARGTETGRRRGFGLGLAVARELAQRANGSLVIERTSPHGTVFLMTLPRID